MSIEKNTINTLRHEESTFTTITNEVLNSIKHTSALGVYCYLASKPSGWNICKKQLQNHFECGREHIDTCFKYLKQIGAIHIEMLRDDKGRSIGWSTTLKRKFSVQDDHNLQNTGFPLSGDKSRIREIQNTGFPQSGFPAPINKRCLEKKDSNINNKKKLNKEKVFDLPKVEILAYNENENEDLFSRSDYLRNQPAHTNSHLQDHETEKNTNKSDYCDYQLDKKTNSKKKHQYDINHMLNDNPHQIPKQMISDWSFSRKKLITQTAWNKINKELYKCKEIGQDPIDAFETMVASGWESLKADWLATKSIKHKSNSMDAFSNILAKYNKESGSTYDEQGNIYEYI